MLTLITCFRVPREAEPPVGEGRPSSARLLRAAVDDAPFGYIEIADVAPEDAAGAVAETRTTLRSSLPGAYEVFHVGDQAAPPFAPDGTDSSVMFVNCMELPPENFDAAFGLWRDVNAYMVRKPGYRWHRLHRRVSEDAPFGLVNVVEWESIAAWRAAHDEGFRERAVRPQMPMKTYPTLCNPA
jgi:hypothetical protein